MRISPDLKGINLQAFQQTLGRFQSSRSSVRVVHLKSHQLGSLGGGGSELEWQLCMQMKLLETRAQ